MAEAERTIMLCGTKEGTRFWINNEPCGLICGCMTYLLVFYGQFATTKFVIIPWMGYTIVGILNMILFNAIALVAMYSHFKAMTTDPGAVPKAAKPTADDEMEREYESNERWSGNSSANPYRKFCRKCRAFKPIRAHHCSICGRCIVKMDHHCPWVNNCVGIGNHKLFLLFIFWIFIVCMYSLVLVIGKYVSCLLGRFDCRSGSDFGNIGTIMLIVESALFGIFTLCMMADQSTVLMTNQTQIDRLKNANNSHAQTDIASAVGYNEVFGCPADSSCSWRWLLPTPVGIPDTFKGAIFGYDVTCSKIELSGNKQDDSDGICRDIELGKLGTGKITTDSSGSASSDIIEEVDSQEVDDDGLASIETNPLLNSSAINDSTVSTGTSIYPVSRRAKSN